MRCIDPQTVEIIQCIVAKLIVRYLGKESCLHTMVRNPYRNICWRSADEHFEIMHVLERLEFLLDGITICRVEIKSYSSKEDDVEWP